MNKIVVFRVTIIVILKMKKLMSLTEKELEILSRTVEQGLGLSRIQIKVYNNNPYTIKLTDTHNGHYFVVQHLGRFNLLIKPQKNGSNSILDKFEDVILHLIDWQIQIA
ncbi:MAG: hypothetical protein M0D57_09315 [Sphingobacteriales bacterium JAD_PAG50586_3]|nr:MAG: hypothetical protein M0D57_09315 [Sphingobacteriales bacterium JAD_PAG50586_3]